jgi:hypothetical protein
VSSAATTLAVVAVSEACVAGSNRLQLCPGAPAAGLLLPLPVPASWEATSMSEFSCTGGSAAAAAAAAVAGEPHEWLPLNTPGLAGGCMPDIAGLAAPAAATAGERGDAKPSAPGQLWHAKRGGCRCHGCGSSVNCMRWLGADPLSTGEGGSAAALLLSGCCCSTAGWLPHVLGVLGGCNTEVPVGLFSTSGLQHTHTHSSSSRTTLRIAEFHRDMMTFHSIALLRNKRASSAC